MVWGLERWSVWWDLGITGRIFKGIFEERMVADGVVEWKLGHTERGVERKRDNLLGYEP